MSGKLSVNFEKPVLHKNNYSKLLKNQLLWIIPFLSINQDKIFDQYINSAIHVNRFYHMSEKNSLDVHDE